MKARKRTPSTPKNPDQALAALRRRIDQADRAMIRALANRFQAVVEIGEVKRAAGLPILAKGRWAYVVEERLKLAEQYGLSPGFTRDVLTLIHIHAIKIQKKLKKAK